MTAKCRICHRQLKNPRHAAAGIGPTCADKLGLTFKAEPKPRSTRIKAQRVRRGQLVTVVPLPFDIEPEVQE